MIQEFKNAFVTKMYFFVLVLIQPKMYVSYKHKKKYLQNKIIQINSQRMSNKKIKE